MFRRRGLWLVLTAWLVMLTACSASNPQPPVAPPAATSGSQAAPPTNTLPPVALTNTPAPTEVAPTDELPQPTDTIEPTTALASTLAATLTRTPKPRLTVATVRPKQTAAPLTVTYEVVGIKRQPGDEATLVMKVYASGGSGGYRYYHDDVQQPSATFSIPGRCGKPFVHTLKVVSGDGQTAALPYHIGGVCPTPTP